MLTIERPKVYIGNVIQNALIFNLKNWDNGNMEITSLKQAVLDLFSLLQKRNIDYVLVGGIALLQYIEGRNTEDIDLIMSLSSLKNLTEIEVSSQNTNFVRGAFNGLQIAILLTQNQLFEQVQKNYKTTQTFVEQDISVATVEGLLLLKLYALPSLYRQGNFSRVGIYENDIATLLYEYHPAVDKLLEEIAHHLSESDLMAVKEVVKDIQLRISRFGDGFDELGRISPIP